MFRRKIGVHLQNQNNLHRKGADVLIHAAIKVVLQSIRLLSERVEYKQYNVFIIITTLIISLLLLLLLLFVITFMRGIYNYIHEPNHVSRIYNVAANM
jgi:hypothetical protein